jgi:glycerophosphoryl diester phosphodiesterase
MVKILGHRGNPAIHPDNTLLGIESAAGLCDGVEIDFRRCATGELVLSHDPTVAGRVVSETPLDVLVEQFGVATAKALFDLDLDADLDLEVKNWPMDPGFEGDHGIGFDVAAFARPRDVVTCFYWPTVDAVKAMMPHVATGLLFESDVVWAAALNHALRHEHGTLAPHHTLVDGDLVGAAHEHAIDVAVWTVDDRVLVRKLVELGVDTIITNRPADVMGWVQEDST